METFLNDLSGLESRTVRQLRSLAKSLGIVSNGKKEELVSALRAFSLQRDPGSTSVVHQEIFFTTMPLQAHNASKKRKTKAMKLDDASVDSGIDSKASEKILKLNTKKKHRVEDSVLMMVPDVPEEHRVKSNIGLGTKRPKSSEKITLTLQNETIMDNVGPALDMDGPWTVLAHKKAQKDWVVYNPKTMRPPPLCRDCKSIKIVSWNVNGLRALLKSKSSPILQLSQQEDFDILCLQETKLQAKDVKSIEDHLVHAYDSNYWSCSVSKLGYSGTAIISRIKSRSVKYGLGLTNHDGEGRLVTAEFDNFYILSGYVPNSGDGLKRLTYRVEEWDTCLSQYIKDLEKLKPVVLCGDLNCAHEEIDIYDPSGNRRSAGFTDEERQSFEVNFLSRGLVDTFRMQNPGVVGYTYWGYRHGGRKTNKGWRLDYFLVSEPLRDKVHDSYILPNVMGSDHCPIGLILKL